MSITFYAHAGFAGNTLALNESQPNFVQMGFNDRASSIIVTSGVWIAYQHVNYEGRSYRVREGKYDISDIKANMGNDIISSAKLVTSSPAKLVASLTLYEHPVFKGTALPLTESVPNFSRIGFNNVTSSIIVTGGTWILYEHVEYKGKSMVLAPGNHNIQSIQLVFGNDKASSVKLMTSEIVLYEHSDFKGKALPLTLSTPNLVELGLNEKTSSIIVVSGTWTIFERANYKGKNKQIQQGSYNQSEIVKMIGDDVISSVNLDHY